jgi:TorA maturation chaperone TorD
MNNDRSNLFKGYNMLLYFAGSMLMSEPTEECVIDFWMNGSLKNLPVSSLNPRFIKAAGLLRNSCTDKDVCRRMLEEDYSRLFAATGLPLAPPYESSYRKNSQEDLIPSDNVTDFYNSYGWNTRIRGKIPDDHIGIELLFLTRLLDKYLTLDDDPSCFEMRKEIRRFIGQHILSWLPGWDTDVQKHARTLCYKGIGTLAYACAEDIYGLLDKQNDPQ